MAKRYVDGYVLVVPKKNLKTYKKMASDAGKMWMKHGALQYVECVGEEEGLLLVECQIDEVIVSHVVPTLGQQYVVAVEIAVHLAAGGADRRDGSELVAAPGEGNRIRVPNPTNE